MQVIRLLQTILILLSRKQVTAKELAERFQSMLIKGEMAGFFWMIPIMLVMP